MTDHPTGADHSRAELPEDFLDAPEERADIWEDTDRDTIAQGRYQIPVEGDLLSFSYNNGRGDFASAEGVVLKVHLDGTTVEIVTDAYGTEGISIELNLADGSAELIGFDHGGANDAWQVHRTEAIVPVSQVQNPGIEEGDHVKVRLHDQSHYVENVENGRVSLSRGTETWSVPVTHVTAFDEDVNDFDPFETFWDRETEAPAAAGPECPDRPGE